MANIFSDYKYMVQSAGIEMKVTLIQHKEMSNML